MTQTPSPKTIFLTGATGFLGTEIAATLLKYTTDSIYVLVRANSEAEAYHRLKASWHAIPELFSMIGKQFFPITGDFTKVGLDLTPASCDFLKKNVDFVFHCGAEVGVQKEAEELLLTNRTGTENVVKFAQNIESDHKLTRFLYISTAYVAGRTEGIIEETSLNDTTATNDTSADFTEKFSSYYEQSKAEAEVIVTASGLPYTICRPGMIIGNSVTGRTKNFNTIYYMLKLLLTGKLSVLPVDKNMKLNLVPVDYVAETVVKAAFHESSRRKVYHVTCSPSLQPTVKEMVDHVQNWAEKNLNLPKKSLLYVPATSLTKAGLSYNRQVTDKKKNLATNLLSLSPYFCGTKVFSRQNTDELMGEYNLDWHDYIDPILTFACRKNFMHQTERTVFEQAMVRRDSKKYPMNYYDVSAVYNSNGTKTKTSTASGKAHTSEKAQSLAPEIIIRRTSGPVVNRRIRQIMAAMRSHGIKKGDKIALTGINSVQYMTIDMAIGLIGATSVPIYYTAPVEEIELLLDRSGAKWFFIGDRRIMEHLDELSADGVKIVAFSNGLKVAKARKRALSFKAFLEGSQTGNVSSGNLDVTTGTDTYIAPGTAASSSVLSEAPDPEDLATIRYTSGTTGEPKGVTFQFHQLAWMGEVLTNLLDWQERNDTLRYLSFLPQSHVVEGILASYAPYYTLSKVDFYYLNDFSALADALPKIRPTVFFSVPRFYEKVWNQLANNKFGKIYLNMEDGPAKKAMAAFLRKIILKKAGLDACKQLIVGSAPMSEELLHNFRELGVEIYNAYGQTEAPLLTINRFGDNVIPSIGTPLPDTEITIAEDGELIARSPMVTPGYYNLPTDTIQNGVLKTGDLGTMLEDGHILLKGRKKDMIITSYGKNINITKLEERLKDIPMVSEAVLIGEQRPYCTALLWLEEGTSSLSESDPMFKEITSDLDQAITRMNADLSHPEQIRKYRIIETPLSIAAGELTPNLKVKRGNVTEHYKTEIEEMYK